MVVEAPIHGGVITVAIGSADLHYHNQSLPPLTPLILDDDSATVTLSGGASHPEGDSGGTTYLYTATLDSGVAGGFIALPTPLSMELDRQQPRW